jgi:hypothetical protein
VHSTRAASDKVYQLHAQGRWFSPGTPASSTTKTGRQDIAEILLKVALNIKNKKSIMYNQFRNLLHDFSTFAFFSLNSTSKNYYIEEITIVALFYASYFIF